MCFCLVCKEFSLNQKLTNIYEVYRKHQATCMPIMCSRKNVCQLCYNVYVDVDDHSWNPIYNIPSLIRILLKTFHSHVQLKWCFKGKI